MAQNRPLAATVEENPFVKGYSAWRHLACSSMSGGGGLFEILNTSRVIVAQDLLRSGPLGPDVWSHIGRPDSFAVGTLLAS